MAEVTVNNGQKVVTIKREFEGLDVSKSNDFFGVQYIERIYIDGELESEKKKCYRRDLNFWMNSPLGEQILGMINSDLETGNVQDKLIQVVPTEPQN